VATHLYATTDVDGVTFTSRHGDDLELWAIFERPGDPPTSPRLVDLETHPLSPENRTSSRSSCCSASLGTPAEPAPARAPPSRSLPRTARSLPEPDGSVNHPGKPEMSGRPLGHSAIDARGAAVGRAMPRRRRSYRYLRC